MLFGQSYLVRGIAYFADGKAAKFKVPIEVRFMELDEVIEMLRKHIEFDTDRRVKSIKITNMLEV